MSKALNEYATRLPGGAYEETPKAVYAALAYSLALRLSGADDAGCSHTGALQIMDSEWAALHRAGIVPQKPRTMLYASVAAGSDLDYQEAMEETAECRAAQNPHLQRMREYGVG